MIPNKIYKKIIVVFLQQICRSVYMNYKFFDILIALCAARMSFSILESYTKEINIREVLSRFILATVFQPECASEVAFKQKQRATSPVEASLRA